MTDRELLYICYGYILSLNKKDYLIKLIEDHLEATAVEKK